MVKLTCSRVPASGWPAPAPTIHDLATIRKAWAGCSPCGPASTPAGGCTCPALPDRSRSMLGRSLRSTRLRAASSSSCVAELRQCCFSRDPARCPCLPVPGGGRPWQASVLCERLRTHILANSASSISRTSSKRSRTASATSSGTFRSASLRASWSRLLRRQSAAARRWHAPRYPGQARASRPENRGGSVSSGPARRARRRRVPRTARFSESGQLLEPVNGLQLRGIFLDSASAA